MQNRQHNRPWWWTLQQESMAQDRQVYELTHRINKEKNKQGEFRHVIHSPQQTQLHEMEGNLNLHPAHIHQPPQSDVSVSVACDLYAAARARNDRLHAELRQRDLTLQKQRDLHGQRTGQAYCHCRNHRDLGVINTPCHYFFIKSPKIFQ